MKMEVLFARMIRKESHMKKIVFTLVVLSIILSSFVCAYAVEQEDHKCFFEDPLIIEEYIKAFLTTAEPAEKNIVVGKRLALKNAFSNKTIAYCYSINEKGYAIINLSSFTIHEYDLYNPHPVFNSENENYYYGGLFVYMYEREGKIVDASSGLVVSEEYLNKLYENYENDYPLLSADEINQKVRKRIDYAERLRNQAAEQKNVNAVNYRYTGSLTLSYSTVWQNGQCGATACANLVDFCARRDGDYRIKGGMSQYQLISELINWVTPTYGTDDLVDGVNGYIADLNESYSSNPIALEMDSAYYQFGLVRDCIDQNIPITVGGAVSMLDGSSGTQGHVVAIWGYGFTVDVLDDVYEYQLRVNNGWGSNSATITYSDVAPSTLADHVFLD